MHALINQGELVFDSFGQGPAVVLLHDLPLCRKMWQSQAAALVAHGFRVIVPDLRGFGESEAGFRSFNLKKCADDIVSLLHYLGIGRAVMVGMGMAAGLIADILQRYPRRVAAACLLSPKQTLAGTSDEILRHDLAEMVREGHRLTAIDILCRQLFPEERFEQHQNLEWEVQGWMEKVDPAVLATAMTLSTGSDFPAGDIPVLILRGSRTAPTIEMQTEQVSDLSVETIVDAGHLVNLEQPEQVNRYLLDFLKRLSRIKPRHYRLALAA